MAAALALHPGEMTTVRYRWQNPGESTPRWKIVRLAYYAPWDWVIGTGAYEEELQAYWDVLKAGRSQMVVGMGLAGLTITVLVGLLGALLAWIIVRPIRQMTAIMEKTASGELSGTLEIRRHDEIGVLARVFNAMTEKLYSTLEGLKQSEAKYRRIFEHAIEGLFQSTLEGRFLNVNPAMVHILGYDSPEDLIESISDMRTQLYLHPEDRDQLVADLQREGSVIGREVQFRRKDGQVIWVSLEDRIRYDTAGRPLLIEGFLVDVSEKRRDEQKRLRLEEQVRQAQKMETIGLLAGGIAHDFNNLLTVIDGYTEIALSKTEISDELRHDLIEVKQAAGRAEALTSQLLAFGRKQLLTPRILNIGELIDGMEKMLKRLLSENIDVHVHRPADLWTVLADPGKIEQVIMNLSINARDAMPEGGVLSIETSNVVLNEDYASEHEAVEKGDYVLLVVSDTGLGMDQDTQRRIFEPFFTTKERGKGTGLGLSVVYGIVNQSGGRIFCYSEVGKGTTFKIYLPRADDRPLQPRRLEKPTGQPIGGSETVLLVEDDEPLRRLTASMLGSAGYSVLPARCGDEALLKLSETNLSLDLLITDVVLPRMDGKEVARKVRERFPTVCVLYMSGYTEDAIAHNGLLEEGIDLIPKPFDAGTLLQKMREILGRPRSAKQPVVTSAMPVGPLQAGCREVSFGPASIHTPHIALPIVQSTYKAYRIGGEGWGSQF